MKNLCMIPVFAMLIISLSGCGAKTPYPYIKVQNNCWSYSSYNRKIDVGSDYVMSQSHSYDIVETEQGVDVVIHFTDKEETE